MNFITCIYHYNCLFFYSSNPHRKRYRMLLSDKFREIDVQKKKPKYLKKMSLLRLSLSETVEYLFIKWNASIGRLPQRPSNEGKHLTPANINAGAFVEQIVLSVPYKDPIRSQFLAISLLLVSRSANLRVTIHEIYNLIIQLFSFYNF